MLFSYFRVRILRFYYNITINMFQYLNLDAVCEI